MASALRVDSLPLSHQGSPHLRINTNWNYIEVEGEFKDKLQPFTCWVPSKMTLNYKFFHMHPNAQMIVSAEWPPIIFLSLPWYLVCSLQITFFNSASDISSLGVLHQCSSSPTPTIWFSSILKLTPGVHVPTRLPPLQTQDTNEVPSYSAWLTANLRVSTTRPLRLHNWLEWLTEFKKTLCLPVYYKGYSGTATWKKYIRQSMRWLGGVHGVFMSFLGTAPF